MKHLTFSQLALALPLVLSSLSIQPVSAATTPAGQDHITIHTSVPKKSSDALFSYTAEWRVDNGELFRATGMGILNAKSEGEYVTKKLHTGLKDGLMQLEPVWRGIVLEQTDKQPVLGISNKAGYSLASITVRDYTNQLLSYDVKGKTFSAEGVQIAIDLVLAADVEFIEGFSTKVASTASVGEIEISIDGQKPVVIKTDGKTTSALEDEIAKHIAQSHVSKSPLVPSFLSNYDKNIKPFDGSEVQLNNLAAKSISIDIRDPELGVLTKFKYKDENTEVKVVDPLLMLPLLVVVSLLVAGFYMIRNLKRNKLL